MRRANRLEVFLQQGAQSAQATVDDYRQHHILFAVDNQQDYVRDLISMLA